MKILSLDLSAKCTGWSIFKNGILDSYGKIEPNEKDSLSKKISYIIDGLESQGLFDDLDDLVIEDVYIGVNPWAAKVLLRLSGAVIYKYYQLYKKEPRFVMACHARKALGIKALCHKADVQIEILNKFKMESEFILSEYAEKILELQKIESKGKRKYQLDKLSDEIGESTGINEDIADSILLGLSYFKELPTKQKRKHVRKKQLSRTSGSRKV